MSADQTDQTPERVSVIIETPIAGLPEPGTRVDDVELTAQMRGLIASNHVRVIDLDAEAENVKGGEQDKPTAPKATPANTSGARPTQ